MKIRRVVAGMLVATMMVPLFGANIFAASLNVVTAFKDVRFRQYVRSEFDTDGNGFLSDSEISEVTEIDCHDMGITTLEGIGYFRNLQRLDCGFNRISELDLSANKELISVTCHDNGLTSINVQGLTNLNDLFCSYNELTSLNVTSNTNLKTLYCGHNNLQSLSVMGLTKLATLSCPGNKISALYFNECRSLEYVECSFNNLTTINGASSLVSLAHLECPNNKLTSLDLSASTSLHYVDCSNNYLTSLDLFNAELLDIVRCRNNQITSLTLNPDAPIFGIDCTGNKLTSLDLRELERLQYICCSDNELTELKVPVSNVLDTIYCANNNLTELDISGVSELIEIVAFGNNIASLNFTGKSYLNFIVCDASTLDASFSSNRNIRDRYDNNKITHDMEWANFLYTSFGLSSLSSYTVATNGNVEFDLHYYFNSYGSNFAIISVNSVSDPATVAPGLYMINEITDSAISVSIPTVFSAEEAISIAKAEFPDLRSGTTIVYAANGNSYDYVYYAPDGWTCGFYCGTEDEFLTEFAGLDCFVLGTVREYSDVDFTRITATTTELTVYEGLPTRFVVPLAEEKIGTLMVGDMVVYKKTGSRYSYLFINEDGQWELGSTAVSFGIIKRAIENGFRCYVIGTVTDPGAESPIAAFAGRLYTCALNREAEEAGKAYWTTQLENGASAAAIAHDFLFSSEIQEDGVTDSEWIIRTYKTFMNRTPNDTEIDYWLGVIAATSREMVFNGFIGSPEWIEICAEAGINPGEVPPAEPVDPVLDFATRLYTTCLGRSGDESGILYWADALRSGNATGTGAAHTFFFSDEFIGGEHSNSEFVRRLYRTFMDREGSDAEIAYWVTNVEAYGRESVFAGFAESQEFAGLCQSAGINP